MTLKGQTGLQCLLSLLVQEQAVIKHIMPSFMYVYASLRELEMAVMGMFKRLTDQASFKLQNNSLLKGDLLAIHMGNI